MVLGGYMAYNKREPNTPEIRMCDLTVDTRNGIAFHYLGRCAK